MGIWGWQGQGHRNTVASDHKGLLRKELGPLRPLDFKVKVWRKPFKSFNQGCAPDFKGTLRLIRQRSRDQLRLLQKCT